MYFEVHIIHFIAKYYVYDAKSNKNPETCQFEVKFNSFLQKI